jgi:hypothetical protein
MPAFFDADKSKSRVGARIKYTIIVCKKSEDIRKTFSTPLYSSTYCN